MKDLIKVDSSQIFDICKNITVSLFTIIAVLVASYLLPFYCSPVIGLIGSAFIFSLIYNNKLRGGVNCMLVPYTFFFALISYSFISIFINVLYIWDLIHLPDEFVFFNYPYIPTLWMVPITFITLLVIYIRRKKLRICIECKINNGTHVDRGVFGSILNTESRVQLKNLLYLFGALTVVMWAYYIFEYKDINTNAKDRYIFFWVAVILITVDIVYFLYRYYNLFLDLKENDELISPRELREMEGKTYIRYYVICGNKVYLDPGSEDVVGSNKGIDTPFFIKRNADEVNNPEVLKAIKELTGDKSGELRFFFGRKMPDIAKHFILRFFYFLDGKPEDYEDMKAPGGWFDFEEVKTVYNQRPDLMATLAMHDLTRLATIVVTEKRYKENGQRRNKIKNYTPSFDLIDVRDSSIDFQNDKWIKVAVFNADSRFYRIRRWWHNLFSGNKKSKAGGR